MLSYLEIETGFIEMCRKDIGPSQLTGQLDWVVLPNQVQLRLLDIGVLEIKPSREAGQYVVISCGIHGNETAPIEIVSRLISQIVKGWVEPKVNLLFILGNPESMKIADRFVSINMNRLFAGAHARQDVTPESSYELARAASLEGYLRDFFAPAKPGKKLHLDMHTAIKPSYHKTFAIRPYNPSPINDASRLLLKALGIEAVLQHNKPSTTFSYFSVAEFAAEAYTLELGKVRPFGENNLAEFKLVIDCLDKLVVNQPVSGFEEVELVEYKVVNEIVKHSDAFKFFVPESVENFTPYPQGALIAEDIDFMYRVAFESESVVFPNNKVPVGQRVAVMVTKVN